MHTNDVQILLDLDVLVGLSHAAREWPVDEPGDAALPPEPRVGAPRLTMGAGSGRPSARALARRMCTNTISSIDNLE